LLPVRHEAVAEIPRILSPFWFDLSRGAPTFPVAVVGAHRGHHLARFFHRWINFQDVFAEDLIRAEAQVLPGAVVVKSNRAALIDRDNNIGATLDEFLKVL
jgi:hypothetical protein